MAERIRIAFCHDWIPDKTQELSWKDGLARAVQILSERHELKFFTCGERDEVWQHPFFDIHVTTNMKRDVGEFNPDVILHWADTTRPNAGPLSELGKPMALCFAGGQPIGSSTEMFDHFFVESQVYYDEFEAKGYSVSRAFGTNTELFKPIKQPKIFAAVNSSTFCDWKRHKLFADAMTGYKTFCFGFMYPVKEAYCWQYPQEKGVMIAPHLPADVIPYVLNASHCALITSKGTGGSQRSVLEAMACNIPVIVMHDSDKCSEYIRASGIGKIVEPNVESIREAVNYYKENPEVHSREWIMKYYSEYVYADNLEKGLCQILK